MKLEEAKDKFVQAWGNFGSSWGINKTMAQVHALLLVSVVELSADDIMEKLDISRGNANMNIRALIDWGLVHKIPKMGERREFFTAEKDICEVVRRIIINRKKIELEPAIQILAEVQNVEEQSEEKEEFVKVIQEIEIFSQKADQLLDKLIKADAEWLMGIFMKII
jgi:DNA-binding transcriptional regulator GbsR (MarR family)